MSEPRRIPIFPLGIVLLPGMALPLHIFEARYKRMIRFSVVENSEFGVVHYDGKQLMATGCTARIIKLLKRYPDGRLDILTRGKQRFKIEHIFDEKSYLEADVSFFDDIVEEEDARLAEMAVHVRGLVRELFSLHGRPPATDYLEKLDLKSLSFLAVFHSSITPAEKQRFLEIRSTGERLQKAIRVLRKIIARVKLNAEIRRIIEGNGYLRHD